MKRMGRSSTQASGFRRSSTYRAGLDGLESPLALLEREMDSIAASAFLSTRIIMTPSPSPPHCLKAIKTMTPGSSHLASRQFAPRKGVLTTGLASTPVAAFRRRGTSAQTQASLRSLSAGVGDLHLMPPAVGGNGDRCEAGECSQVAAHRVL